MPEVFQYDVFIGYASADFRYAEQLYDLLKALGYRVFLDSKALVGGDSWTDEIRRAQEQSQLVLILISDRTDKAYFTQEEILHAIGLARDGLCRVVPVYLTDKRGRGAARHELKQLHGIFWEDSSSLLGIAQKIEDALKASARPKAWQHEIVAETVIIVTGCHHLPEIYDRPCAYSLKAAIDLIGRSLDREFLYSVVMGDIWFLQFWKEHGNVVSIGSKDINNLSEEILKNAQTIRDGKKWKVMREKNRWALFGQLAEHTREAVNSFKDRDLQGFLGQLWPKPVTDNR